MLCEFSKINFFQPLKWVNTLYIFFLSALYYIITLDQRG